jgi:hypothetical protein
MPSETKVDPFKPQQPIIPGVADRPAVAKPETAERPPENAAPVVAVPVSHAAQPKIIWIVLGAAAVVFLIGALIVWSKISASKPAPVSADRSAPSGGAAPVAQTQPSEPVGPGEIASVSELAKPWAAKHFQYRSYTTGQLEPAMVVHLPHGEYWAFSLNEPFGTCQLEFITDLEKLRADYGYHADHPMVGNPCNHTVYDLLRYGGGASGDDLVRGVIVQGNGIRPPMAIEIKVQGTNVVAGRSE